jgi:hypothetical protein
MVFLGYAGMKGLLNWPFRLGRITGAIGVGCSVCSTVGLGRAAEILDLGISTKGMDLNVRFP